VSKRHFDVKVIQMCSRVNANEYVINVLRKPCFLYHCSWVLLG